MNRIVERPRLLLPPTLSADLVELPFGNEMFLSAIESRAPVFWPVCKPCHLGKTKGLDLEIKLEHLQEIARSYDPVNIEAAAVNIDHERTGPAHGWVDSYLVREGLLFAKVIDLSDELREGIRTRRFTRQSMEIVTSHPVTGGWYGHGLAILGANRPAVKGLPPITLSERPAFVFLREEPPAAAASGVESTPPPPPAAPADPGQAGQPATPEQGAAQEEVTMTTAATTPAAGATTASHQVTPSTTTPPPATTAPPATTVDLTEERRQIAALREQMELDARAVRRRSVELDVDKALDTGALAKKVTPAQLKAGARELLVELKLAAQPLEVTLAAANGATTKTSGYEALVGVLAAQPEIGVLGAGVLAEGDEGAALALDDRTAEEKATHQRMGLSDADALKLRAELKARKA